MLLGWTCQFGVESQNEPEDLHEALRSLKRIADLQAKDQACRCNIDYSNEPEAGGKGVGSIVEKTDHVRSSKAAKLSDRINEPESGSGGRFT